MAEFLEAVMSSFMRTR